MNASRRRGRSLAIVASLASGGFLVLAVSAMQNNLAAHVHERWSSSGGFELYAESTVPIVDAGELLETTPDASVYPVRVFDGDDASCLNLNQAQRPRVLGVDARQLAALGAFSDGDAKVLWESLSRDAGTGVIPALVGDSDTAMWTLKKRTGAEDGDLLGYRTESGDDVSLKLVGKLPMRLSVFSGTVLVSAENFTRLWPSQEGFRVFLLDVSEGMVADAATRLQDKFDRYGLEVVTSGERLEMFHAVERTYLNMFLVLGGMGLLLGATATGVVVLRNLLERRRELALLRALGFSPSAMHRLLLTEFGFLLLLGTSIGALASVLAMLPALTAAHGGASVLWKFTVFGLVLGAAGACVLAALSAGLRHTSTTDLRAD